MRITAFVKITALIFPLALAAGRSSLASDEGEQHWKNLKAQKPAKASLVPSELVEKIKTGFGEKPVEKTFMSADVYFFDHHHLIDPPVKVTTPLGGGTIDLDLILPEGKAKFAVRMDLIDSAGVKLIPDQVYFIPKISQKKEGREVNCGKYFEITRLFVNRLNSEAGLETYLTQGIYASLFVGTFVFVKKLEDKVLLGNLNLTDSRFAHRHCPQFKEAPKE